MKRILLLILVFTYSFSSLQAQVALAKLKFEDAEQAFNNGNYTIALTKLNDAEKLFGKINPLILHLRILVQDKLLEQKNEDYHLMFEFKKNCQQFLKDYAEAEGLEDKYRDVYKLSEKHASLPSDYEELKVYQEKKQKEYLQLTERFKKILLDYITAIGGETALRNINTISYNNTRINSSRKDPDFSAEVRLVNQQKVAVEGKLNRVKFFEYLDNTKGFTQLNMFQPTNRTPEEIEANSDRLSIFPELSLLDKLPDSIKIKEEKIDKVNCYVLQFYQSKNHQVKLYFSQEDKLKKRIQHRYFFNNGVPLEHNIEINNFIPVQGIKFIWVYSFSANGQAPIMSVNSGYKLNPEFKTKDFEN